jgi:cell division protein FtsW
MRNPIVGLGGTLLIVAPLAGLVFVEPDRGTAFLLGMIALLIALVAGVRLWHMGLAGLLAMGLFVAIVSQQHLVRTRFDAFLHPELHKGGASDQAMRSLSALEAGGIDGRGLGLGSVKFRIPEQHTDFILAVVGEELGLWFTLAIVGAFLVIMYCGFSIAARAPDRYGQLLAAGITFLIVVQAMINIAVVTNSMPNKGMPLPFLSRGGSSIAIMLSLVGILLNIARESGNGKADTGASPAEDLFAGEEPEAVPAE